MQDDLPGIADETASSMTPVQWWLYLQLSSPRTASDLVATSGIARSLIRLQLDALSASGVVSKTNGASGSIGYVRSVSLSDEQQAIALDAVTSEGLPLPDHAWVPSHEPSDLVNNTAQAADGRFSKTTGFRKRMQSPRAELYAILGVVVAFAAVVWIVSSMPGDDPYDGDDSDGSSLSYDPHSYGDQEDVTKAKNRETKPKQRQSRQELSEPTPTGKPSSAVAQRYGMLACIQLDNVKFVEVWEYLRIEADLSSNQTFTVFEEGIPAYCPEYMRFIE